MLIAAAIALALAVLYAALTALNLAIFRAPRPAADTENDAPPAVSILIPVRNEADHIDQALDAVLASRRVTFEVVVLDDDSEDDTAARVAARADRDARLRLVRGAALPAGWSGKQYACAQLAEAARFDRLMFIDADVRLAPDAVARAACYMRDHDLALASGFPREIARTLGERLLVPMIHVLLLGYLPLALSRRVNAESLAAGCGQLMMITRVAYAAAGGHGAIRQTMHDGLRLPRQVRKTGGRTDIFNAAELARCRMYPGFGAAWAGFSKNATEGMATPVGLPIWSLLLGGGHLLPVAVLIAAWVSGASLAAALAALAIVLVYAARAAVATICRQHPLDVLLHPLAVAAVLTLQWRALWVGWRGTPRTWRGRRYD